MWRNPEIRKKILETKHNKSQEEKDHENELRSKSLRKFWKEHPEERKQIHARLCGTGNPMYGRRKMFLISDPSISIIAKPDEFDTYLKLGYEFSNITRRKSKVNSNQDEKCNQIEAKDKD